jgi:hypothetical protein
MGVNLSPVTLVRRLGPDVIAQEARRRLSSAEVNVGLRCDLEQLPEPRPAKIPISLERPTASFTGFDEELERATGQDYGRVLSRRRLLGRGIGDPHVATDEAGEAVYVQWLIDPTAQKRLEPRGPGLWRELGHDEVLLEFAYTFIPFRGKGVMGDAMGRLLRVARDRGARRALTYVRDDNIASLRGCANVGFDLDHVRTTTTRFGVSRHHMRAPDAADRQRWADAIAPRPR